MKRWLTILVLLLPSALWGATGDTETVIGKTDTGISTVLGKTGSGIATVLGKNYTDGDGGGPSYIVNEGFEAAPGYDNAIWTEYVGSGATVNEDYTTTVLEGTQSLYTFGGTDEGSTYASFTCVGAMYWRMMIRWTALPGASATFLTIRDSSGNVLVTVQIDASGHLNMFSGGGEAYGGAGFTASADTTYYLWGDYTPGTGSNGTCHLYASATSTRPSALCTITNSTRTANAGRFSIGSTSSAMGCIFDQVLIDNEAIADGD